MQSFVAPGCCTAAFWICSAVFEWQVRQSSFGEASSTPLLHLGRLVTGGAAGLPGFKRRVHERRLQLRPGGLVRIVAGKAIGGREGLPLMSLDQLGILRVMTIHAQSRASSSTGKRIPFPFPPSYGRCGRRRNPYPKRRGGSPPFDSFSHFVARQADIIVLPHARIGFTRWSSLSEECGLWHLRQSRTAGLWMRPLI